MKLLSRSFQVLCCLIFCVWFLSPQTADAARTINNITLDGGASTTVAPSATMQAAITVSVNGNGAPNRWYSTRWTIGSQSGCENHGNHSNMTATEVFNVIAPANGGTYNAVFTVYGTNNCSGNSTSRTMNNAVVVSSTTANQLVNYHFDEIIWNGTSGQVEDDSGNNHDASSIGGASTLAISPAISGNPGTCRYGNFDGSGDYVDDPNADQYLDGLTAVTVMAWVRNTDAIGHDRGIFTTGPPNANDNRFALRYDVSGASTGHTNLLKASVNTDQCNDSSDCLQVETESNLQLQNGWQHVAMTWQSGDKIRIYINASEVQTTVTSSGIGVHNGALDGIDFLRIGQGTKSGTPSPDWQGHIDEFRIYDQALDATAIGQAMSETLPCTAPLAEYRFEGCDWTTGATVIDELGAYPGVVVQGAHTAPGTDYGGGLCDVANLENEGTDFNRYISLAGNPISLSNDWSLMMWINFPPVFTNHFQSGGYRYSVISGGTNDLAWIRQRNSDGYREWGTSSNPSAHRAAFPSSLTGWHHLTFVASGSSTDLYVDGVYSNTVNYKQTGTYSRIGTSADDAFINNNRRQNLDTQLDELKFYTGALSASQIAGFYALEAAGLRWDGSALNCQICGGIDHIRIEHSGAGLTCQRSDIILRACADASCSSESTNPVTVTMTPSSANPPTWIGGDSYTFTGSQTVQLRQTTSTTPGTLTLGLTNPSPVPTNGYTCYDSGNPGDCDIVFYDSGFIFDVPDLTSCQTSLNVSIQAVRTDATTQMCVADGGFAGATKRVNFWSSYVNPNSGSEQVSLGGTNIATSSPGTGLSLTFDGTATSNFTVTYPDAGQMQLNARYDGVAGTEEAGLVMLGNDIFVARPVGLCVYSDDANSGCASGTGSCSVFKKVDEAFNLKVKGVCWESSADTDLCTGNVTTQNFQLNTIPITHSLVAPSSPGSSAGTIDVSTVDIVAADHGEHVIANQAVSEVGVFTFTATPPVYFGSPLPAATSEYIGRFTPDHFITSIGDHGAFQDSCSGFTYSGQPFGYQTGQRPQMSITAARSGGTTTVNYRDDFVKLIDPATQISMPAVTSDASQTGADGLTLLNLTWAPAASSLVANDDGTLDFTLGADQFIYTREANALIAPFNSDVQLTVNSVTDSDGIAASDLPRNFNPASVEIRYGRMQLQNAFGPETLPLTIPVRTEYFDGTVFTLNSQDSCSTYDSVNLSLGPYQGNLLAGDTLPSGNGTLSSGEGVSLLLSAPGTGRDGSVDLTLDLSNATGAGLEWLQPGGVNPTAKATFGIFRGNPRLIYTRESVW